MEALCLRSPPVREPESLVQLFEIRPNDPPQEMMTEYLQSAQRTAASGYVFILAALARETEAGAQFFGDTGELQAPLSGHI